MTIGADSTLLEVLNETIDKYVPTSTDLDAWTTLDPATGDTIVTTTVGLFGADLTDFLDNCALATLACAVSDYDTFSGWAIGIEWVAADSKLRQAKDEIDSSVTFADQNLYVETHWSTPN